MDREKPPFTVVLGGGEKPVSGTMAMSPAIPPLIGLTTSERRVWDYICTSLRDAGLEHITAGLPIAVIVRTYTDWLAAAKDCNERGRYQMSGNGWSSETPWAADERRLKTELGQWLPKACLTIPSATRVKKDMGIGNGQDDLFGDLVEHARQRPSSA